MALVKYYFWYNAEDSVIEEGTMKQAEQTSAATFSFDSLTGQSGELNPTRHPRDVSTFLPLCHEYVPSDPNSDSPIDDLLVDVSNRDRFQLPSGVYKGTFTVHCYGKAVVGSNTVVTPFGSTLDNGSSNVCAATAAQNNTININFQYVHFEKLFSGVDYRVIDNDIATAATNPNDGLSSGGRTDQNGDFYPWSGVDAKITLLPASNVLMSSGWYYIELDDGGDTDGDGTNQEIDIAGAADPSLGQDGNSNSFYFWNISDFFVDKLIARDTLVPANQDVTNTIVESTSGSYDAALNELTYTITFSEDYTDNIPSSGNVFSKDRKIGYIIWKDGTEVETNGVISLVKGSGASEVSVDPVTNKGSYELVYAFPTPSGNNADYTIQLFEHTDTYRHEPTSSIVIDNKVNNAIDPNYWDGWFNYYDAIMNSEEMLDNTATAATVETLTDSGGTFISIDSLLSEESVTVAEWCNDTLYAFEVSNGRIVTTVDVNGRKGFKLCGGSVDFIDFSDGLYCDAPITIWTSDSVEWANETEVCQAATATSVSATIKGRQTPAGGSFAIFSSGVALADGWYGYCGTEVANVDSISVTPESVEPCDENIYWFQVGIEGNIVTTIGNPAEFGFKECVDGSNDGITFVSGKYCDQNISILRSNTGVEWASPEEACLACGSSTIAATVRGNTDGNIQISDSNGHLPEGYYAFCTTTSVGGNIDITPNPLCTNEYFIYISTDDGNWDGIIFDCNSQMVDAVQSTDWFDESPLTNYTVRPDSTPWRSIECELCADEFIGAGTLYVSGNLTNATQPSEELKIYSSPNEQDPLTTGWYRTCSLDLPVANGVAPERQRFDCYGNPFIWYSTKNSSTYTTDENNYLTNGTTPWFNDAPVKDLTSTGCDLAVAGWTRSGNTSQSTIEVVEYQSGPNTICADAITSNVIDLDVDRLFLTRSNVTWYPTPETGQKIISSYKEGSTEMTIAVMVECESYGTIFKITDVTTTEGSGIYSKLQDLSAVVSSIELERFDDSGNPTYRLTTTRNDFTLTSQNSIEATSSTTGTRYEIVVIKISSRGHSIRVNGGVSDVSDTIPSNFCSDAGGITNLNVEIGANRDTVVTSAVDMNFAEMIIYDEELNQDEIKELEGYLSSKWCQVLSDISHPYYDTAPDCGVCEDECCNSQIFINGSNDGTSYTLTCSYNSSESMYGYQFKLVGLDALGLDINSQNVVYTDGETITSTPLSNSYTLSFEDPQQRGFKNYLEVASDGVWVYGHFNELTSVQGDAKVFSENNSTFGTNFLNIVLQIDDTGGNLPNFASVSAEMVVSEAGFNSPSAPHPIIISYDKNAGLVPVSQFTGDENSDGEVSRVDAENIIKRISKSHTDGPYDLSGDSWLETIDARAKGWVDISDVATCLLNIIAQQGTHLGDPAPYIRPSSSMTAVSHPICSDRLEAMKCIPCPCPEEVEEVECVQKVWISDIQPADSMGQFGIVTVRYESSCCIDGYKLVLGGFNDKALDNPSGFHDGAVMVPSQGDSIGQITDGSETHLRGWLHGLTLNPEYKGEVAALNISEVVAINSNIGGNIGFLSNKQVDDKLMFPIVWGMSLGQDPSIPDTQVAVDARNEALRTMRLGINCIPATCKGDSKILTKFVINLRSFINPHISEFRLVTNDKAVTPCSFDSDPATCSNITWTSDSDDSGTIGGNDFASCLIYMYSGWSQSTVWDSSLNDPVSPAVEGPFTLGLKKYDSEFDSSYIDVVDGLTTINHLIMGGGEAPVNKQLEIVPRDCCPCDVPGDFSVTLDVNSCDCTEEGYIAGKEGHVTVSWTPSADAEYYEVYRIIEEQPLNSSSYSPFDPFNLNSTKNIKPSLLQKSIDYRIDSTINLYNENSLTISNDDAFELYREKIRASKNPLDYDKWVKVYTGPSDVTTFEDGNPPKFENCCPDDDMPVVKYIVVAKNDCGEKNATVDYIPECCGYKPQAEDVDLGTMTVNSLTPMYAKAYHPFALNPYGGITQVSTAEVTINSVPSTSDTVIKLIKYDGTVVEFAVPQSGTARIVAEDLVGAILVDGNFSASIADAPEPSFTIQQLQPTICGNTKVTVSGGDTASVTASSFTGGNIACNPEMDGYPEECENLAFFITSVSFSAPHAGDAMFVGPSGGGALPSGNMTGIWSWKPPTGYIGAVTFTYIVINQAGCFDTAEITVNYGPVKLVLDCDSPPCDSDDYGKVFITLQLPKTDNLAEFIVLRKPSTVSTWNIQDHALQDENGNFIKFNVTDYKDNVFTFVDDTMPMPDECCEDDLSYDYIVYYCESSSLKVGQKKEKVLASTVVISAYEDYVCTYSTECTVVIPCCGPPSNVLPVGTATNCIDNKYSEVELTWAGIDEADSPYIYVIYRREAGEDEWEKVTEVNGTAEGKNDSNPNWDVINSQYVYQEEVITSQFCDDDKTYEYAIITIDTNKKASGNPSDVDWANLEDGSPCSPGGTTVSVTVESCPPDICAEDVDLSICIDEDYEYDLRKFVDCVAKASGGGEVDVTYTISSQSVSPDFGATIDGSTLTFNTRQIASEGTHNGAIVISARTDAPCASVVTFDINIILNDCGCPCPDDEADYTICDNNYDNEEYTEDGSLVGTEQIPFSLTNEGGQALRKGQPYVVSKGKIDCE